jgi:predicted metal-dependent hydrolase
MGTFSVLNMSVSSANNMANYNLKVSDEYKSDIESISALYKRFKFNLDDLDEEMEEVVDNHSAFLRDNKPWYHNYFKPSHRSSVNRYFLKDPIYLNWVDHYEDLATGHYVDVMLFKIAGNDIYNSLARKYNFTKDSLLVTNVSKYQKYLGIYKNETSTTEIKQHQGSFSYKVTLNGNTNERRLFFDTDSTFHTPLSFGRFKGDTVIFSFGSRERTILTKEKQ